MQVQRVVITGMGVVSAYGRGLDPFWSGLRQGESRIDYNPELKDVPGLGSCISGRVPELPEKEIPRRYRRSMSGMSLFAAFAAREAVRMAGLEDAYLAEGRAGVSMSSTVNSPYVLEDVFRKYLVHGTGVEQIRSTNFFKIMNHSCAANVAQYLGISGRVISPGAACATGGQAIALGAEAIAAGKQDVMLCGGADEVHPLTVGTFDMMDAASVKSWDDPGRASRPFDADRDGVVCSEGSGVLVLESLPSALKRGVPILGEIAGWSMNCAKNLVSPDPRTMRECILSALQSAGATPGDVDYINAHATSTIQGDADEAAVLARIFENRVPVSSLKGHLGHTMAASGALETAAVVKMMSEGMLVGTRNLENIDPDCAGINLIQEDCTKDVHAVLKNNFAFGGINTALFIRRFTA